MPAYGALRDVVDTTERNRTISRLLALREQLDKEIPIKTATETLLLATWNIREFGDNRRSESLHYLAEVISRFDLIAIQEVGINLGGLQKLVALLGPNWDYIVTDSTEGPAGGGERMAFIYDRCKVFFRKMAGELVLPPSRAIGEAKLQFARTPFSVAFQANWFRFILTTVHILFGENKREDDRRIAEIATVAKFIKDRANKENENYILLGDFNIFKTSDATMKALEKEGFYIPMEIRNHPSDLGQTKHYDQIAFKLQMDPDMTVFSENEQRAGTFSFAESVFRPEDLEHYRSYFDDMYTVGKSEDEINKYYLQSWRTYEMSDHLPMWIELKIDFSNQYLKKTATI